VEQELREAMLTGRLVDWRAGDSGADDPAHGDGWDAQRTVSAALLAELLTNRDGPRRPRALRLAGARIIGQLDLEAAELVCELLLGGCWFAEPVILDQAQAPSLRLPASHLPGLSADRLATRGNLQLGSGFAATGEIRLRGAHIGGQLDFGGATLTNPSGSALDAEALTVADSMSCLEGIVRGEVNLRSAHIGGQLTFHGATLSNPEGRAVSADGLTVDESMFCGERFAATGEIRLRGVHIGGQLDLDGATLTNPDGYALAADGLTVDMSMFCGERFAATGEVSLLGAHIGGQLTFRGATLTNPDGHALSADELTVDQGMYCPASAAGGHAFARVQGLTRGNG
jgi:adhesin HecA-like repeat protein